MTENNINNKGFQLVSRYRSVIMGIAALAIYYFHAWVILSPEPQNGGFSLLYSLETYIKVTSFGGVDVFLFLSGMGLTFAIQKESLPKFYYRRFRRILLPALAVGIVRGIVQDWGAAETFRKISGYYFFTESIYKYLWFVHAIVILYIFFPLYYKLFAKAKNKILFTAGAVMIWFVLAVLLRNTMRLDMICFFNRIPVFLIGILFGHLTQKHENAIFSKWIYLMFLIMFGIGLYLAYLTNFKGFEPIITRSRTFLPPLLIAVSSSFLIAKIMEILERRLSMFGKGVNKVLSFLGMISLELYCIQWWFADMVSLFVEAGWNKMLVNLFVFTMTVATSWVISVLFKYFWEAVEIPFKKEKAG